jgi:tRNA A37 threonylcarbamoyladenosine modification protein TsaB
LIDPAVVLAGSGADALAAVTAATRRVVHRDASPDLAALLRLAEQAPPQAAAPRPLYLRPPDAKPQAAAKVARR